MLALIEDWAGCDGVVMVESRAGHLAEAEAAAPATEEAEGDLVKLKSKPRKTSSA